MFTNLIFSRLFSKFFTIKDVLYAGEGAKYANTVFSYFKFTDFILVIFVVVFIILSIKTMKYIEEESKKKIIITSGVISIILICTIVLAQVQIGEASDTTKWDAFKNKRNIYNQFNDTKRSMMLCGLYEYSLRDFYLTFIKSITSNNKEDINAITEYFDSNDKSTSDYNGVFKDKNLILIMLENIDSWMLNEIATPTLYSLRENSINFTERYAANYASGYTFNTEFIANTGLVPNVTTLRTAYSYNQNNYDYSLPTLFKDAGYIVNSIHKNKGNFYNRDNIHVAWGYENHFSHAQLGGNKIDLNLDTLLVSNNLDKFIYDSKFMTFWITYSAHMPYQYTKPECDENIDYIKSKFDSDNEEYLCAMSEAKVTDDSIKILIDALEKQGKLDDTVLVFFTDHYAYSMDKDMVANIKNETDKNMLTKTPFFIYDNGNHVETIDKVNSTVDILPTIADLFGLNYNPNIYFGDSIFSDNYNGFVVFNDGSWYDGNIYYKTNTKIENVDEKYISEMNSYTKDLLTLGGKIIETDYFRKVDINSISKN